MPSAFILGAGQNVGKAVAQMLAKNGYQVALGARSHAAAAAAEPFVPVHVDVTQPESIAAAFKTVEDAIGAPGVVVYNVGTFAPLPTPNDPLSLPTPTFLSHLSVGSSVFAAAREALARFRALSDQPKVFILTGNITPFVPPAPGWTTIQSQKVVGRYLVELFAGAYAKEDIRFYFASEVAPNGGPPPGGAVSGPGHAIAYERLLKAKEPGDWDVRFIADGTPWEKK